jgi:hypothetical protein
MGTTHRITMEIPDDVFVEIVNFKKKARIDDNATAAYELIKHALTLPAYFAKFDWKEAEKVADEDIEDGKVKSFSSVEDLMTDLKA